MDAIDLLQAQHDEIRLLAGRMQGGAVTSRRARKLLAAHLCDLLAVHMIVEERFLYRAIENAGTEERLLENAEEHLSAKRLIADLVPMDPDASSFAAKLAVLSRQISAHMDEEERILFPLARTLLTHEQLIGLGAEMEGHAARLLLGSPRVQVAAETVSAAPIY